MTWYKQIDKGVRIYEMLADTWFTVADLNLLKLKKEEEVRTKYFSIVNGAIEAKKGYQWDGATGIPRIFQSDKLIVPSLIHDILCLGVEVQELPIKYRKVADKIFYKLCRDQGISWLVSKILYRAVRRYANIKYGA